MAKKKVGVGIRARVRVGKGRSRNGAIEDGYQEGTEIPSRRGKTSEFEALNISVSFHSKT